MASGAVQIPTRRKNKKIYDSRVGNVITNRVPAQLHRKFTAALHGIAGLVSNIDGCPSETIAVKEKLSSVFATR